MRATLIGPPSITDVCLLSPSVEESIDFYTEQLGFTIRSRMPGFVDFYAPGLILALWESKHLEDSTTVRGQSQINPARTVMLACELSSPSEVDRVYEMYRARGVDLYAEPKDYPWNARCIYFDGPNGELWEYFAWYEGGEPGIVNSSADGLTEIDETPSGSGGAHDE